MENCSSNENMRLDPLDDDDFSELTKNEILRWAQLLNITPSELYSLSQKDLEQLLTLHLSKEIEDNDPDKYISDREEKEQHAQEARKARWQRLRAMKDILLKQQCERLKGGDECRTIWQILAAAAVEIEANFGPAAGSKSKQGSDRERCCGGSVGPSDSADTSFRPRPIKESILKTSPDRKSKFFKKPLSTSTYSPATYEDTVATETSRGPTQQSYNSSQAESALGVTFSQAGRGGGPSFVQESSGARHSDGATFNQGCPRARSAGDAKLVQNSTASASDDQTFNQGSPIRRSDYARFVRGTTFGPQSNQIFIPESSGRARRV